MSPIGNSEVFKFTLAKRFEESEWPLKNQMYKWHPDRLKRLWVPADVRRVGCCTEEIGQDY